MNITCPHCSQTLELTPEVHAQLQGQPHFACPTCHGLMAVPPMPASAPKQALRRPADIHKAAVHAQRGLNRNMLVLGIIALLALGGLATFLASRNGGSVFNIFQNITNQIIHNSYFTQLIASGVTTEEDLKSIGDIRPYGDGFIGVSKEPLTWEQSQYLAKRTGAEVLGVEAGSKQELLAWLTKTFSAHLPTPVWVHAQGEAGVLAGSEILASKEMDRQRKVLLHWQAADKALAAATKDKPFVNKLGMKFVPVPGTKILMCIHETRRQDYAAYAAEVPGVNGSWKNRTNFNFPVGDKDDHPVVSVSWEDGQAFCVWLSKKEAKTYRLPTDREWSFAVGIGQVESRMGDVTLEMLRRRSSNELPWIGGFPPKTEDRAGNFADNSRKEKFPAMPVIEGYTDGFATTAPVMSFNPNKLGIYDLAGNVWEWCEDWWDATKTDRVLRGGCYGDRDISLLRSASFTRRPPDVRGNSDGFRVVIELSPTHANAASLESPASQVDKERAIAVIKQFGGTYEVDPNLPGQPIVAVGDNGWKIDDAGMNQLKSLRGLSRLKKLTFGYYCPLTDSGLAAISEMKSLEWIKFWACNNITDEGWKHLGGLPYLNWLNLGYTGKTTGAGLKYLRGLTNLRVLILGANGNLEGRYLESLMGMDNLESLDLAHDVKIDDADLDHIKRLAGLKSLALQDTQVSDAGLLKLKELKQLKTLRVRDTKVTDAGIADLQKEMPGLNINRD